MALYETTITNADGSTEITLNKDFVFSDIGGDVTCTQTGFKAAYTVGDNTDLVQAEADIDSCIANNLEVWAWQKYYQNPLNPSELRD